MKTKNQYNKNQEVESVGAVKSLMYMGFCLLLSGGFVSALAAGGVGKEEGLAAQSSSSGHSGTHLNEERLHTAASVLVLRVPTTSSGK